jgi:hypothetical protein
LLDLSFRITDRYRPFELLAPGFEQVQEPAGRVVGFRRTTDSPVAPFVAVELAVTQVSAADGLVAGLATAQGDHLLATYSPRRGVVEIEIGSGGRITKVAETAQRMTAPFGFAFVLCENQVTVVADTGNGWLPLLTERDGVAAILDLRDPETLSRYAFAFGTRTGAGETTVDSVRAGAFGYTGLRDPHLVQRPDGSAVVRDGKAYLTFTCAGMGFFQQAHWGVFTLDLTDPRRLVQVAQLYTQRDGVLLGDHAGQLVVDDDAGTTIAAVSSWGDFGFDGVHVRHTSTDADLLSGVHLLNTERLELPIAVGSWDPSFTRIDDRWHVAFVESPSQAPFSFHPALAVGPTGSGYDSGLELVGRDEQPQECEGPIIQRVEGEWYVVASNKDAQEYRIYDLSMRQLGVLDAPYVTNIPHPQIVDVPGGGHLVVTFDGTQYAEDVMGYGGHGDVVVMTAS